MANPAKNASALTEVPQSFGKIKPLHNPPARLRPIIREILEHDEVFEKLEPYFLNGGVCGSKVMDVSDALNVVLDYDKAHGNRIASFELRKKVLADKLLNVMRERYLLNRHWKIAGQLSKAATPQA